MNQLFEQSLKFKQGRNLYNSKYNEIQDAIKNEKLKKTTDAKTNMYANGPMTEDQLNQIGKSIDTEYNAIPKEVINNYDHVGIPGVLCFHDYTQYFEGQENHKKHVYDEKKPKQPFKDAGKNCKAQFFDCIQKIKSFGIEIYNVTKSLKKYKNRTSSSCGGGTDPFHFYCGFKQYRFKIVFDDDCDCYPGLLYIKTVENTENGQSIEVNCDLYCENTSHTVLDNFLMLINATNVEEYQEKRYGHYFVLPKLLAKNDFVLNGNTKVELKDCEMKFSLDVTTDMGDKCILMPFHDYKTEKYMINICPSIEHANNKVKEKNKNSDFVHNQEIKDTNDWKYHDAIKNDSFVFDYDSVDKIDDLIDCIDAFLDKCNGSYGYADSKHTFRNDKEIVAYCKEKQLKYNVYCNNYYGPDFDVSINLNPDNAFNAMTYDRLSDMEYISDFYCVRMWYNRRKDTKDCFLTIQGKCIDVTKLSNAYYDDKENFKLKDHLNIKNICDMITIKGSYDECFDHLKHFFANI